LYYFLFTPGIREHECGGHPGRISSTVGLLKKDSLHRHQDFINFHNDFCMNVLMFSNHIRDMKCFKPGDLGDPENSIKRDINMDPRVYIFYYSGPGSGSQVAEMYKKFTSGLAMLNEHLFLCSCLTAQKTRDECHS